MRTRLASVVASISIACVCVFADSVSPVAQSLADVLDSYGDGRSQRIEFDTIDDLLSRLRTTGTRWVDAGTEADRIRRRQVVVLFALDAVLRTPDPRRVQVIEWACGYLRQGQPTEFERLWLLASIALAQSERFEGFLLDESCAGQPCYHLRHARSRFPDDRRFAAGTVFGRTEVNVVTPRPVLSPTVLTSARPILNPYPPAAPRARDADRVADTLRRLAQLSTDPVVGPTARLRIGILHYELRRFDESRRMLGALLETVRDPYTSYFARLIMGLGFDAEHRPADAAKEFAAAVAIDPYIVSGAIELASHQFASGAQEEATMLLDRAFSASPVRNDPWQYRCPDCGDWTDRLERLHVLVRR